jgi:hypothetical protein
MEPTAKPTSFRFERRTEDGIETIRRWLQKRSPKLVSKSTAVAWMVDALVAQLPDLERQRQLAESRPVSAPPAQPDGPMDHAEAHRRTDAAQHRAAVEAARAFSIGRVSLATVTPDVEPVKPKPRAKPA